MKKILLASLLMCGTAYGKNAVYQLDTDTVTVHSAIIWPDGSVQKSSPTAGGIPGGSNTQIQYNNSNAFAGASHITTDGSVLNFTTNNTDQLLTFATGSSSQICFPDVSHSNIGTDSTGNNMTVAGVTSVNLSTTNGEFGLNEVDNGVDNQVAINATGTPDASAVLDLGSSKNNLGFLPPRISTGNIVSPVNGLIVFSTNTSHFYGYNGSWKQLDN